MGVVVVVAAGQCNGGAVIRPSGPDGEEKNDPEEEEKGAAGSPLPQLAFVLVFIFGEGPSL